MKKVLGLFLSFALVVSVLSGIDLFANSKSASAETSAGGQVNPNVPTVPPVTEVEVQIAEGIAADPEPTNDVPGGNVPNIPPVKRPPSKAPCLTWNGSTRYPVDGSAVCAGTISETDGSTYNFNCPVSGLGTSAIYVEYEETISYETLYWNFPISVKQPWPADPPWPVQVLNWGPVTIARNYSLPPLSGTWNLKAVQAWKTDIQFPGAAPAVTARSNWISNTNALNTWKRANPFNHQGFQQGFFQATSPTSSITKLECKYPYKPVVQPLYYVTCFVSYDSSFYQAQTKDAIRNGGSLLETRRGMRAGSVADINNPNNYGVTVANHLNCNSDSFQTSEVYATKSPEEGGYGYYRLSADVQAVRCYVEGYPLWTQNHDKDRITGCTQPFLYNTYNAYAVYSCNGFISTGQGNNAWAALPDNENFAVSACEVFQCDISGTVQIGGTSNALQVMRNGENLPVTYPTVTIDTGGSATSRPANSATSWEEVTEAASGVLDGSSPFKGTNANDSKQYFGLRGANPDNKLSFLTARNGDAVNSNNSNPSSAWQPRLINGVANDNYSKGFVNFNWASAKDTNGVARSWNMFRSFRVHGEFYVPIASGSDGATTMGWQKETKYCGNVISNPVTVVRSVNEIK